MGKHARQRRSAVDDYADDDIVSSCGGTKSMNYLLEQLFEKRGSTRESALSSIIEGFTVNLHHQFAEKYFATLMHRCLNSIKRGSPKEICLASHVMGLLAITIGCGDNAHELFEESLPPLSQALKHGAEATKILDCLAIVTFVGGHNSEDIERSMQIIWQFIHPGLGSNVAMSKHSADVLCAAISAWSFLLTMVDGWKLSYKYWKGAISHFLDELEDNEESVRVAAGAALGLIVETGCLEKFSSAAKVSTDKSIHEGNTSPSGYSSIQELRDRILKQDGYCPEISMKIGGQRLTLSTWSQSMQLNFLKRFLGGGFVKHMLENNLLHDVFEFTPTRKHQLGNGQFISDREEVRVQFYLSEVRKQDCSQRIFKSPNSFLNKARTKLLNKQRMLSQGRDLGHYMVDNGSEAA
ncbi:hypothetical protein L1049_015940 [Liquidambar formosana]|uniref:Interferon-related developmental regulator 1 n=1 Tax=Liquidambar formosana TaxID=63359 RepID=A0AAP0RZT8_LIQFO